MGYALAVAQLLACPFCRQLYPAGEASRCPDCDVGLRSMESLPPSLEALAEEAEHGEVIRPVDRPFPAQYLGRGRGALLALSVLGLAAFFAPWVVMQAPDVLTFRGFDLARGRAGWLWGGAVAWFVMIPLIWTRRTIAKLRGVRIICALFASMTLGEVAMLLALPPQGSRFRTIDFSWGWGLYASGLISVIAMVVAARLGGRIDDLPAVPWRDRHGRRRVESSDGETLH